MQSNLRVGIDSRSLAGGPPGVATCVANLIRHLPCLDPFGYPRPRNNLFWNLWWGNLLPLWRSWRIFHAPAYTCPLWCPVPVVLTVHDVSYLAGPEYYPYHLDRFRLAFYRASIRRADLILVPSEFSRSELARFFPGLGERVRVTQWGVHSDFFPDADARATVRGKFDLEGSFLLHVGDVHRRRNLPLLAEAATLSGIPLVAVGRLLEGELPAGVRRFEGLSVTDLRGLYHEASALVYASEYEGFGLPILEAMACGLPVVAVPRASLPEVGGDAAIWVEGDPTHFAEGIRKAVEEREEFSRLGIERASSFTWERTAELTLRAYREAV